MQYREQKRFDPGFINCVVHSLTGAQVLYHLMHTWNQDDEKPVVVWCHPSDGQAKANAIRVALSKERKDRKVMRTFALRFSEPYPCTHLGIKGEAITVYRHSGGLQTRMQAAYHALQQMR